MQLSEQKQFTTTSMGGYGYRGWGGMGGGMATTTQQNIPIGTLIVDLVDPATHEMVWRGTASDQVSGSGADQGKIERGHAEALRELPAGARQQITRASTRWRPDRPAAGR